MLLRTRLSLIIGLSHALLAGGLILAGQIDPSAQAVLLGVLVVLPLLLALYLRRALRPLDEAKVTLDALARGDLSVALEVENPKDEIGRMAGAIEAFRQAALQQELAQQRHERQRRRDELFIRVQMRDLCVQPEDEAAALQPDLGAALQALRGAIGRQQEGLHAQLAERLGELDMLRQDLQAIGDQLDVAQRDLDSARALQMASLPRQIPERDEFTIHAGMVPGGELGGGFCDFFLLDRHHLALAMGTCLGKGVPAAMFMAVTRSLIKAVAPFAANPGECLGFVNAMLAMDNPQTLSATCFYGVLDLRSGEIVFGNAGHAPPLVRRHATGMVEAMRDMVGMTLGVTEDVTYQTGRFPLSPGDTVLLYTASLTQDEPGLMTRLTELAGQAPEQIVAALRDLPGEGPQAEDMALLALRFDRASTDTGRADPPKHLLTGFKAPEPPPPPPAKVIPLSTTTISFGGDQAASVKKSTVVKLKPKPKPAVANIAPPAAPPPPPPEPPPTHLEVVITNDLDELTRLAGLVDGFVARNGFEDRIAFNLNLCLDELITNIVSYGYDDSLPHHISVRLSLEDGAVVCRIEDDGKPSNPFVEATEPGGAALGAFLVKEFMDRTAYDYDNGRNRITLWKRP